MKKLSLILLFLTSLFVNAQTVITDNDGYLKVSTSAGVDYINKPFAVSNVGANVVKIKTELDTYEYNYDSITFPNTTTLAGLIDTLIWYNAQIEDYWLKHAIDVIRKDYGVSVSARLKVKDLLKYGETRQAQTTETTLMTLPTGTFNESYVDGNLITHFSSSAVADSQQIVIEGHTIDGSGNFTFVTQTVTLAGQTKTALTTPLARSTRLYNNDSTDMVGTIYVAEDVTFTAGVPQVDTTVHLMVFAGLQQSQKASTTISNNDYWIVTSIHGQWLEKGVGYADVIFQRRLKDKTFREVDNVTCGDGNSMGLLNFKPYVIIPANSDVRLVTTVNTNGKRVGGSIQGILVKVID